jgi:hypothetical protein
MAQFQPAGTPTPGGFVCVERGPDSKVWQRTVLQTNQSGAVTTHLQSYTELATGLCYPQDGQYVDSVEEVDATANGAQAIQGRHQVQWSLNANNPNGAVILTTPDGKTLTSTVFGLAYYDVASGSNAVIARLQDCNGSIVAPNQVVYASAFSNLTADVFTINLWVEPPVLLTIPFSKIKILPAKMGGIYSMMKIITCGLERRLMVMLIIFIHRTQERKQVFGTWLPSFGRA